MKIRRGHVYWAELPGQTKRRPCVVVSADWLNEFALDVCGVPLTTVVRAKFLLRVGLAAGEGGLAKPCWAKCDQVTTIEKSSLIEGPLGRLPKPRLAELEAAILLALGIDGSKPR